MSLQITEKKLRALSLEELERLRLTVIQLIREKRATEPPKKRGRKGTKILDAFKAIPENPVLAEEFCKQHGIALNTLRQHTRFDATGIKKPVHVMKPHRYAKLYVWRGDEKKLFEMFREQQ